MLELFFPLKYKKLPQQFVTLKRIIIYWLAFLYMCIFKFLIAVEYLRFTILTICNCILQYVFSPGYSHCCATNLQNFVILQNKNSIQTTTHFPLTPVPGNCHSAVSMNLTTLDTAYKWKQIIWHMQLAYFT